MQQKYESCHAFSRKYNSDGKYIIDDDKLIICQSKAGEELNEEYVDAKVNPLGYWTGGIDVDSGATNRKLGSDMGDAVTGGGIHGKEHIINTIANNANTIFLILPILLMICLP